MFANYTRPAYDGIASLYVGRVIFILNVNVTAVVPARNEGGSIKATIDSLKAQTVKLSRIIVVANNCTDNTAQIARENGVQVFEMMKNTQMKAGALNYALEKILPAMPPSDCILIMDGDTTLAPTLVESCLACLAANPMAGAVSGIFTARPTSSLLGMLQAMEFWRYRRQIFQNGMRAFVLTGTASLFKAGALKAVKAARFKGTLPRSCGSYYDTIGRTEDNEMTLALLTLGYDCLAADTFAQTDVMESPKKLFLQRERWYNGALINLKAYGKALPWYLRWVYWRQQIGLFLSMIFLTLMLLTLLFCAIFGMLQITWLWLLLLGMLAFERTATVWRLGVKARLIALCVIPEQLYSIFLVFVFGVSLSHFLTHKKGGWHAT